MKPLIFTLKVAQCTLPAGAIKGICATGPCETRKQLSRKLPLLKRVGRGTMQAFTIAALVSAFITSPQKANGQIDTQLIEAAESVRFAVNARASDGKTALIEAAEWGKPEAVKLLLENGADVDAKDNAGQTALIMAAWLHYTEIVKLLLEKSADVNAMDKNGGTPLTYAVLGGNNPIVGEDIDIKTVKLLLEHGAYANEMNSNGTTVLMIAATYGHPNLIKLLIENGANVNAKDIDGKTAFDYAKAHNCMDVANLLSAKMGNLWAIITNLWAKLTK